MSFGQRLQFAAVQELEQLRLEKQRLQTETQNLEARSSYGSYGPACVEMVSGEFPQVPKLSQ